MAGSFCSSTVPENNLTTSNLYADVILHHEPLIPSASDFISSPSSIPTRIMHFGSAEANAQPNAVQHAAASQSSRGFTRPLSLHSTCPPLHQDASARRSAVPGSSSNQSSSLHLHKLLFWNISGINSLYKLSTDKQNWLSQLDLLCFNETWVHADKFSVPSFLKKFDLYSVKAKKIHRVGRASGGLLVLVNRNSNIQANVICKGDHFIVILVQSIYFNYICVFVYWPPTNDIDSSCRSLNDLLVNLSCRYHLPIICSGDFNCRVGSLNQLDDDCLEGSCLCSTRVSLDLTSDSRGSKLVSLFEENGFILTNGRSFSDNPGHFTNITHRGASCIDLAWVNSAALDFDSLDFKVVKIGDTNDHMGGFLQFGVTKTPTYSPKNNPTLKNNSKRDNIRYEFRSELKDRFLFFLDNNPKIYFHSSNVDDLTDNLLISIKDAAGCSGMTKLSFPNIPSSVNFHRQPWFNSECRYALREVRRTYRLARRVGYSQPLLNDYLMARSYYRNLIKSSKKRYYNQCLDKISNVKSGKDFWLAIKMYFTRGKNETTLSAFDWELFYSSHYPPRMPNDVYYFDTLHPFLDSPIEITELQEALAQSKPNKAAGTDGINYDFLKNLSPAWHHYLLNLYNEILSSEKLPKVWSKIIMKMLYKKNDPTNPLNYRGIALVNCLAKLFTMILGKRLTTWVSTNSLLPEEQSGFRNGRGCADNLFVLTSLVFSKIRSKSKYLYGIFVDLKRAFDSVQHNRLWDKLWKLGISAKLLRIITTLYESALVSVNVDGHFSSDFDVTEGVLQGETLSPLLFNLFISDFIDFFIVNDLSGVNMFRNRHILALMFADDIVIFADSWPDVQNKLRCLEKYSSENGLAVNSEKTQIVAFHDGSRTKAHRPFMYHNQEITIANSYTYLGVPLSQSGKFFQASKHLVTKAKLASSKVRLALSRSRCDSFETALTLFNTMVASILLYCAELWAPRYIKVVEPVQTQFIKKLFHWPSNTPDYMVRLEAGVCCLKVKIFKKMLKWWLKVLEMPNDRLPRISLDMLLELESRGGRLASLNWANQLKLMLSEVGADHLLYNSNPQILRYNLNDLVDSMHTACLSNDRSRALSSTYSSIYWHLNNSGDDFNYLFLRAHFKKLRLVSQTRICNENHARLYWEGKCYLFDSCDYCPSCGPSMPDTLHHFIFECPTNNHLRSSCFHHLNQQPITILKINSIDKLNKLFLFLLKSLESREPTTI